MLKNEFKSLTLFLVLNLFLSLLSNADNSVSLTSDNRYYPLHGEDLNCWIDSTNSLTIESVLPLLNTPNYIPPSGTSILNHNFVGHPFWMKLTINDLDSSTNWYMLEAPDFHVHEVQVFAIKDNAITNLGTQGFLIPFSNRIYNYKNPCFEITPSSADYFVIRMFAPIKTNYATQILHPGEKFSFTTYEYISLGFYYGILVLLALYNFIIYFSIRQHAYLFYVAYIISFLGHSLMNNGLGYQYIWTSHPTFNYINDLFLVLFTILFSFYSDSFLNLKERFPSIRKWLYISCAAYVVFYIFTSFFQGYNELNTWTQLIPFALILYASIKIYLKGFIEVRYFILAYSCLLSGLSIYILWRYGIFPDSALGVYAFDRGVILEAFFMSIALGDRFRITSEKTMTLQADLIDEQQKNQEFQLRVNQELEQKVQERTNELIEKNNELEALSRQLNKINSTLDKDVWKLSKEVNNSIKQGFLNKKISYTEFLEIFPDALSCQRYLSELKWNEGYACSKCGNEKWNEGTEKFSRKCSKCNHRESTTANTFFHRSRTPLIKSFYLTYLFSYFNNTVVLKELESEMGMSSSSLSVYRKNVLKRVQEIGSNEVSFDELIYP